MFLNCRLRFNRLYCYEYVPSIPSPSSFKITYYFSQTWGFALAKAKTLEFALFRGPSANSSKSKNSKSCIFCVGATPWHENVVASNLFSAYLKFALVKSKVSTLEKSYPLGFDKLFFDPIFNRITVCARHLQSFNALVHLLCERKLKNVVFSKN